MLTAMKMSFDETQHAFSIIYIYIIFSIIYIYNISIYQRISIIQERLYIEISQQHHDQ